MNRTLLGTLTVCAFMAGCTGEGKKEKYHAAGSVQKGPFVLGSTVTLQELSRLEPDGDAFSVETDNSRGDFEIPSTVSASKVELAGTGYFFDEIADELSASTLTLRALSDLSNGATANMNALTDIQVDRIRTLVEEGDLSFGQAAEQSRLEVFAIFGIDVASDPLDELDISQDGDGNASLLAASATLMQHAHLVAAESGSPVVAVLSEQLAEIAADVADDGALDDEQLLNGLRMAGAALDLDSVRDALEARYGGVEVTIPPFEAFVDSDGDGIINRDDLDLGVVLTSDLSTPFESQPLTVLTSEDGFTATAVGGTLFVNGVASGTSATVAGGDTLTVRVTSLAAYESWIPGGRTLTPPTGQTATISLGDRQATYVLKTVFPELVHDMTLGPEWAFKITLSSDESTAFVKSGYNPNGGFRIYDLSTPSSPALLSTLPMLSASGGAIVLTSGEQVALVPHFDESISVVDVSDPALPFEIASFTGRAVQKANDGSFLVTVIDSGLLVFDSAYTQIASFFPSVSNCYSLAIDSNDQTAYLTCGNGVIAVDVSTPSNPLPLDTVPLQNASALAFSADGHLLVSSASGITAFDVSDPADIVASGTLASVNAGFILVKGTLAYLCANDGMLIVDVSDLSAMAVKARYWELVGMSAPQSEGVSVTADGQQIFVGYNDGVRVLHLDPY